MKHFAQLSAATILALAVAGQASAAALDALQGAWTMDGTDCATTFKQESGKIDYIDRTATVTTGIIITGDTIKGPNATCTTQKVRQEKDYMVASMSCADAIMFSNFSVAFRIIDAQSFERFDPSFPEASVLYHKCEF
jgi:hypothetical protein